MITRLRTAALRQCAALGANGFAFRRASPLVSLFVPMLVALLAVGCAPEEKATPVLGDGRVELGAVVPGYSALALNGDTVSLETMRGSVTLLNIWATWCAPCRAEIPELRSLHEHYKARGLSLIGVTIDADGTNNLIEQFMRDFQMTFPVWHDPEERILTTFKTIGVPSTFLVDRKGVLRWRTTGPITPGDTSLKNAIERALKS